MMIKILYILVYFFNGFNMIYALSKPKFHEQFILAEISLCSSAIGKLMLKNAAGRMERWLDSYRGTL